MISLVFALGCLVSAFLIFRLVPQLRAWPPSFGLMVAVLTVVPPHQTIAVGIGADDLLLLVGLGLLLPTLRWQSIREMPYGRWLAVGSGLLISGMTVSAFVNSEGIGETASLLIRGPGRVVLYVVAVLVVFGQLPHEKARALVVRGLAVVGTLESVIGLVAYSVPLPGGFGLEEARGNTTLLGEVPGRITGTLDLSSNFLGALLTLAIPVTLGLLIDARGRMRIGWGLAGLAQLLTLVLTFTRSSLAVTLLACAVLLALRVRLRWLAAGAVLVIGLLVATPAGARLLHDQTDRQALWTSAIRVFADHPVAGVGPGEMADFTAADPERYRKTPYGAAGSNAHNTVLLAAAEDGILGLAGAATLNISFVLIGVQLIRRTRQRARAPAEPLGVAVAVLAFLLQGMVNNLFTVTLTATALVLLIAGCALPWLVRDTPIRASSEI